MQGPETRASLTGRLNEPASEDVWSEFVEIYRPLIFRTAIAKGLQHADAEDLTQEVLTSVRRSVSTFEDRGSGSFRGWLFRITRNLVVNHLTRSKGPIGSGDSNIQDLLLQQPSSDCETKDLFDLEFRRRQLDRAASRVQPVVEADTWKAFWMTAVEGKSVPDVAAELGKSEGAIRMAKCRVLARLQKQTQQLTGIWETEK